MMIPNEELRVLVAEDDPEVRSFLSHALECQRYSVEAVHDGEEALNALAETKGGAYSAVLLDLLMPRRGGLETLRIIRRDFHTLPVIMISAASSVENVATAMKNGATDFLGKPFSHEDLNRVLNAALQPSEAVLDAAEDLAPRVETGPALMGNDPRMRQIASLIPQVAQSEVPILIQGETGVGKEVLARELHAQSGRSRKPFLKLNCAALPHELVESELFGYDRGAFTGAYQRKPGMFELAEGGTILLDEIGDMEFRLQAKLLQVLQDREFQRLGGKETIRVNVRVMAATHRDLEQAMAQGTFRVDLYYRLNVVCFKVPPLRDRLQDLMPLAEFLLAKHVPRGATLPEITPELQRAMMAHSWPGNIREVENLMRKLAVLRDPDLVAFDLEGRSTPPSPATHPVVAATPKTEDEVRAAESAGYGSALEQATQAIRRAEADTVIAALNSTRWNRKRAAAMLNIEYKALLYKMKKLSIESRSPQTVSPT
jgi:two-component system response regulator AtoC